ncbi:MAG TPA: chloride channel protein [Chromatiaceae bacterium]|nr:chloride channel protein [Chromatiaceae bacterium]
MSEHVNLYQRAHNWISAQLETTRLHLARPDALILLAAIGLLTGVLAGLVIVAFRLLVEQTQGWLLPGDSPEAYELLPQWARLALPLAGAVLLAIMFRWLAKGLYVLGVARLLERMAYHQGHLSMREFLLQFFGAAIAIISGHSVGREGPHIFLGAAAGSLLGQKLALPNNAIRTLVGCGTAAGIAASFNTPLAGVIFALEVVMLDYHFASFIPVILSAVAATLTSNVILGSEPAFSVPTMALGGLSEIPLVIVLGLIAGAVSASFTQMVQMVAANTRNLAVWWKMLLAGLITGALGLAMPEIMGIGYDTVSMTLLGSYGAAFLLLLMAVKLIATSACVGLGVPGGMIGPALFIGATLGGGLGHLTQSLLPQLDTQAGFFAMLGMGALMGASLQAPLAALTALLELTNNPQIIVPGMLVVIIAGLTASELFGQESLFITMLKAKGLDYQQHPVLAALRRIGVANSMDKDFVRSPRHIDPDQGWKLLENKPRWIVITEDHTPTAILSGINLAGYLEGAQERPQEDIDLMEIPGKRLQLSPVHLHETLQEALDKLNKGEGEALYVRRMSAPGIWRVYGILTREQIESAYQL